MSSEFPSHIRPAAHSPLVRNLEQNSSDLLKAGFYLAQDGIHQASLLLTELERLGKQSSNMLFRFTQFQTDLRHTAKSLAQEATQDSVEVVTHVIHSLGEIARSAVSEIREVIQAGEGLAKDLPTGVNFKPPFQQRQSKRSKEPTIIPITIQDN